MPCGRFDLAVGGDWKPDFGGRFDLKAMVREFRRTLHEKMVRFLMAASEGDGEEAVERGHRPGSALPSGRRRTLVRTPRTLWESFRRDRTGLASPPP